MLNQAKKRVTVHWSLSITNQTTVKMTWTVTSLLMSCRGPQWTNRFKLQNGNMLFFFRFVRTLVCCWWNWN